QQRGQSLVTGDRGVFGGVALRRACPRRRCCRGRHQVLARRDHGTRVMKGLERTPTPCPILATGDLTEPMRVVERAQLPIDDLLPLGHFTSLSRRKPESRWGEPLSSRCVFTLQSAQ